MDKTDKYQFLAAVVRAFFSSFTAGIIDCHVKEAKEKGSPRTVKRVMIDHYEEIADNFNEIVFLPLAVANRREAEMERIVKECAAAHDDMQTLIRKILPTQAMYNAMVAEYKRNFQALLQGVIPPMQNHLADYTRGKGKPSVVDTPIAIRLLVRTTMKAYARGIRRGGTGKKSLHQPTLYRLLFEAMVTLLHSDASEATPTHDIFSLGALFLRACRTKENLDAMMDEMNATYEELVSDEGIIARDDTAN